MTETLEIQIERSTDQKSITITDITDWSTITGTIDSLTSIVLNFYTTSTASSIQTYTFTELNLSEYTSNGEITLTFAEMFSSVTSAGFIADNWYIVQMTANDGDYISNYEGFGTYVYIKTKTYELINGLRTPEEYRGNIEYIYQIHMYLKGLEYLDTSNTLSRDIKFKKRLSALTKYLS